MKPGDLVTPLSGRPFAGSPGRVVLLGEGELPVYMRFQPVPGALYTTSLWFERSELTPYRLTGANPRALV